jgi:hypothetical protein
MRGALQTSVPLVGFGLTMLFFPFLLSSLATPTDLGWNEERWILYQSISTVVGVGSVVAGVVIGAYDTIAFRKEVKYPTIATEPGEQVIKTFPSFRAVERDRPTQGIWYITSSRLLFHGAKGIIGTEEESLSFSLENLEKVEIIKPGLFQKSVEATFMGKSIIGEPVAQKVGIICSRPEDLRDILSKTKLKLRDLHREIDSS